MLAALTLGPQPAGAGGILLTLADAFATWPPTAWVTFPVLEFAANVALFMPVGVLWVLWTGTGRWWLAAPIGLAMSAAIEATQGLAIAARVADARDLLSNTLGAACAAAILAAGLFRLRR